LGTQEHEEDNVKNVPDTPLGRMYRDHIQHILDKDIESLLNQYTDDALLISSFSKKPLYYRGRDGVREHMQGILGIQGLDTEIAFWAETDEPQALMIVEAITMKTKDGEQKMRFADSWVLRNGKIAIHFAGMTQYPDGTVA
jgi:ketosteroid isomerase-like protein